MSERCPTCDLPKAQDEDWEMYDEGEGSHLCWAEDVCHGEPSDWRARALAAETLVEKAKAGFEIIAGSADHVPRQMIVDAALAGSRMLGGKK